MPSSSGTTRCRRGQSRCPDSLFRNAGVNAKRTALRTAVGLTVFLSSYLAAELLVAPFLADRPGIKRQYFVRDVDHRMPPDDPGIPTNDDGIRSRRGSGDFTSDGYNIVF